MIKKILLGIAGVILIGSYIGWQAMVAIHDREVPVSQHGSVNTLLELISHFADTGKRAQAAYDKGDLPTARRLWQGMAERGNRDAMLSAGLMELQAQGGPADYPQAAKWFRTLAEGSEPSLAARTDLGVMYLKGQGMSPDPIEAQKWFLLAGKTGEKNRIAMDRELTADENAQARKRAQEWKPGK